jgi:hypothetical protein
VRGFLGTDGVPGRTNGCSGFLRLEEMGYGWLYVSGGGEWRNAVRLNRGGAASVPMVYRVGQMAAADFCSWRKWGTGGCTFRVAASGVMRCGCCCFCGGGVMGRF